MRVGVRVRVGIGVRVGVRVRGLQQRLVRVKGEGQGWG